MNEHDPRVAVIQRLISAAPEQVYDEWLDSEALTDWMCPRPARATKVQIDPVVGGSLRFDIEENGVRFQVTGRYLNLDRPHQLSFSWSCSTWPDPDLESIVTVTLEGRRDGETLMTIQHALLPPELTIRHRDGWARIADQLEHRLQGRRATEQRGSRPHAH